MRIVRFEPAHLDRLELQQAQRYCMPDLTPEYAAALAAQPVAFTALAEDGEVLGAFGCVERWPGSAVAWALVSCNAGREMRAIVRAARGFLDHACPWKRIETWVDVDFEPGAHLVRLLGFEREGLARCYRPDGTDATIWAKVRSSKE